MTYIATSSLTKSLKEPVKGQILERLIFLREQLKTYAQLATFNHPKTAFDKQWMDKWDYQKFTEQFELFIQDIQTKFDEKGWYNPFLNRHVFNALRFLPVYRHGLTLKNVTKRLSQLTLISFPYERFPFYLSQQEMAFQEEFEPGPESHRVQLYLNNVPVYDELYKGLRSAFQSERYAVYKELSNLYDKWQDPAFETEAHLNLMVEAVLTDFITELMHFTLTHKCVPESYRIDPSTLFGQPMTSLEHALYLLEHSNNVYELLYAHRHVLSHKFEDILKHIPKERYSAIVERFETKTGMPFESKLGRLVTEHEYDLATSVELSPEGLLDTIRSNPTVRWIRTLNGELYVDRRKLTPEQLQALLEGKTLEDLGTDIKELIRFYRTNVGTIDKFNLLKEMSIYGKEDRGISLADQLKGGVVTMKDYVEGLTKLENSANTQFGKAGYIGQPLLAPSEERKLIDNEAAKWKENVLLGYRSRNPVSDDKEYYIRTWERMKNKPVEKPHDEKVQEGPTEGSLQTGTALEGRPATLGTPPVLGEERPADTARDLPPGGSPDTTSAVGERS